MEGFESKMSSPGCDSRVRHESCQSVVQCLPSFKEKMKGRGGWKHRQSSQLKINPGGFLSPCSSSASFIPASHYSPRSTLRSSPAGLAVPCSISGSVPGAPLLGAPRPPCSLLVSTQPLAFKVLLKYASSTEQFLLLHRPEALPRVLPVRTGPRTQFIISECYINGHHLVRNLLRWALFTQRYSWELHPRRHVVHDPFLFTGSSPLCWGRGGTMACLSTQLLENIWVISSSWLSCVKLLKTFMYRFAC